MDRFVTTTIVPDFNSIPGRADLAKNIWNGIQDAKGRCICVYGRQGCGKTFLINRILGDQYSEHTKPEKVASHTHVVVENPSNDVVEFLNIQGSFSLGTTIIICENLKKIDFCDCFEVPCFTEDQINQLFPGHQHAARMCEGNMWNFEFYKQFTDKKDTFWTPRDYVYNILSKKHESYIKSSVEEHGHTLGMIHENYTDTRGITLDECSDITDSMSLADMYDTLIYTSDWNYCKFFQVEGIARPAAIIDGRFDRPDIRPGSCWTKMNNHKMRMNKLKRFKPLCHDKLVFMLDRLMANPRDNHYRLEPCDVDSINHLKIKNKFKPSEISRLKKSLASYHANACKESPPQ